MRVLGLVSSWGLELGWGWEVKIRVMNSKGDHTATPRKTYRQTRPKQCNIRKNQKSQEGKPWTVLEKFLGVSGPMLLSGKCIRFNFSYTKFIYPCRYTDDRATFDRDSVRGR